MPKYDYECPECGQVKEVSHSFSEIGKIKVLCGTCEKPMKKLLSLLTLIGFDSVGRSVGRKEKEQANEKGDTGSSKKDKSSSKTTGSDKAA